MNKIFLHRLKRKRILEGRVKCHGNKNSCFLEHPCPRKIPFFSPKEEVIIKKKNWFRRLIDRIYGYFK